MERRDRNWTVGAVLGLTVGTALLGCQVGEGDGWDEERAEPGTAVSTGALTKSGGGALGDWDYCNDGTCVTGEGDCDLDGHCAGGLVCGVDNGPRFGQLASSDVCWPATCQNGQQDNGETGVDTGGPCDRCFTGTNGDFNFCSNNCPCGYGQGDCDGDAQCQAGLVCGSLNGRQFGLAGQVDVCTVSTSRLIINEIDYDQPNSDLAEFIELAVLGANAYPLNGVTVELVNAAGTKVKEWALPANASAPGNGYFIIGAPNALARAPQGTGTFQIATSQLPNTPYGLRLVQTLNGNRVILDAVSWEGVIAGVTEGPAGAPEDVGGTNSTTANKGISRCPNLRDTNRNGTDFVAVRPTTVGAANNCP